MKTSSSALLGHVKVDAAMADERIAGLVRDFMDIDITPLVAVPEDVKDSQSSLSMWSQILNECLLKDDILIDSLFYWRHIGNIFVVQYLIQNMKSSNHV